MTSSASLPLAADDIRSTLATTYLGRHLHLHRELPSTNDAAMALAQSGAEHGTVVVADRQTAGRGRRAREWFSPGGVNLYCSVVIRSEPLHLSFSDWLSWIPLASALAITEAVRTTAGVRLFLKWPNDLLCHEKKIGGILCENGMDPSKRPFVVIGIGLNVNVPPAAFPPELAGIAGSLIEDTQRPIDRNRLLSQLLIDLEQVLDELGAEGPRRLRHAYTQACATLGKRVRVILAQSRELLGLAEGIGPDGALLVRPSSAFDDTHGDAVEIRAADVMHLRE
ncbi:biotin--[acetyl-CoA-carboxylase] ligase [Nitrospira moscoviensis]|uniref:biotin--[biotin carboxyl-carrier protein] ligase n=1 Tax=Nitrospira moscoviensis TaxID=42253 RepID=A0A0K2GD54_NITMO|nr:biotin--[acetyl-CoA-carboxylase] ligase [Nitrospira moscoviensis]ALA58886.1 putative Biotin-(Acetyl-CoA-carboxylase) ligase [Nitrospira moscoviensis]